MLATYVDRRTCSAAVMTLGATPKYRSTVPDQHPCARYYPELKLMAWRPVGILDDEHANEMVEFLEARERIDGVSFNRFVDMSGFTRIQLSLDHLVRLARRRREGYRGPKVITALYALRLIGVQIARMYEELMEGSLIEVRTFRHRAAAADWLQVPPEVLLPPRNPK